MFRNLVLSTNKYLLLLLEDDQHYSFVYGSPLLIPSVSKFSNINSSLHMNKYENREDAFFYSLVYDPVQKTLQADKGSIRLVKILFQILTRKRACYLEGTINIFIFCLFFQCLLIYLLFLVYYHFFLNFLSILYIKIFFHFQSSNFSIIFLILSHLTTYVYLSRFYFNLSALFVNVLS